MVAEVVQTVLGEPMIGPQFNPLSDHGFTITTDFEDNPPAPSKAHYQAARPARLWPTSKW
jgi:hypothetical protein